MVTVAADVRQSLSSKIWTALQEVMASECAASLTRAELFRRYIRLAKAHRALQQATVNGEHEVNLEDPAFRQQTFENLIDSDIPSTLLALSRAALLKRLQRARKIGALAEIYSEAGLLSSKVTMERVDKLSFACVTEARVTAPHDHASATCESD